MENCVREPREMEKPEAGESSEAPGRIEKYNVPLNKLKMMFEKGEAAQPKVRVWPSQISEEIKLHQENPGREWLQLLTPQILCSLF